MVGWHEFEQAPGVGDRQGSLVCCSIIDTQSLVPAVDPEVTSWLCLGVPGDKPTKLGQTVDTERNM